MLRTFINNIGKIEFIPYIPTVNNVLVPPKNTNSIIFNSPIVNSPIQNLPVIYTNNNVVNINDNLDLRKQTTAYFYNKLKNSWLSNSYIKLQKYLKNVDGKIEFIKNINDFDKNIKTDYLKIDFIIDNIFGKHQLL
jgi:hypothetical protein